MLLLSCSVCALHPQVMWYTTCLHPQVMWHTTSCGTLHTCIIVLTRQGREGTLHHSHSLNSALSLLPLHTYMHSCTHAHAHMYVHVHLCMYTHTHTHSSRYSWLPDCHYPPPPSPSLQEPLAASCHSSGLRATDSTRGGPPAALLLLQPHPGRPAHLGPASHADEEAAPGGAPRGPVLRGGDRHRGVHR